MRRPWDSFRGDIANLRELPHELCLSVQPAASVDQQDIDAACQRRIRSIEDHRGGVRAGIAPDDVNTQPLGPDAQLSHGCGAECIGRGEQNAVPIVGERLGDLRHRRGLARAVDAGDQDHGRFHGCDREAAIGAGKASLELALERLQCVVASGRVASAVGLAQLVDDCRRRGHARVGGDQAGFELVNQLFAEAPAEQHSPQRSAQRFTSSSEAFANRADGGSEHTHSLRRTVTPAYLLGRRLIPEA